MNVREKITSQGIVAALSTPIFLGMAPIFGKLAINAGASSFTVAAWRTVVAVAFLWLVYALFFRKYIFIYPAGLLGCIVVGAVNGIGSLFYYSGLGMLDASTAQLLNGMYLIFVMLLAHVGGDRPDGRLILRAGLAITALLIITGFGGQPTNWLGVGLMLANALMFGGTVILSQYVLYEIPAPSVTLYVLTTMATLVAAVWLGLGGEVPTGALDAVLLPILALGVTTALSRLALFAGVKFLGSMQTAVLSLTEIGVALTLAFIVLGDRLTPPQVIGVAILAVSILLIRPADMMPRGLKPNRLVSNLSDLQFHWIAFEQAFGKPKSGQPHLADEIKLTTQEVHAIRRMMGVEQGPVSPVSANKDDYAVIPPSPQDDD
jgi:drug/metabolite transporter (DMT)-like permease